MPSRRPTSTLRTRRPASCAALGLALVAGLLTPTTAEAGTTSYSAPLRAAVRALPVAVENNASYDRDRHFGPWRDANGDCQNTRQEVLLQERRSTTVVYWGKDRCTVKSGRWVSSWDNRTHSLASGLQIDHTVPVAEAWGSGAKRWTQTRRRAFYNDLTDPRALSAQTSALNFAKGARGPEAWLPPANRCRYVKDWVAVKLRWRLTVDSAEKTALTRLASSCTNVTVTVNRV
ncbi:DUF1524 domain-containing protein [Kytococcus sedentarius]|uniref:GmrSD restriction endonuclease domain-containing protein n=1 Tax=Kytococcus sedentarius TaxID=1276 RepID=UPI00384A6D90